MKGHRHNEVKPWGGPYGVEAVVGLIFRDKESTHIEFDAVKFSDRKSTSGRRLTTNEKNVLRAKMEELSRGNQRKIVHSVIPMVIARIAIALSIIVFMVAGMTGHQWDDPFSIFEWFSFPSVVILCAALLIVAATVFTFKKRDKAGSP